MSSSHRQTDRLHTPSASGSTQALSRRGEARPHGEGSLLSLRPPSQLLISPGDTVTPPELMCHQPPGTPRPGKLTHEQRVAAAQGATPGNTVTLFIFSTVRSTRILWRKPFHS